MEKVTLPVDLVNAVLQYLGTRPYIEVLTLIQNIQKEAQEQMKKTEVESVS